MKTIKINGRPSDYAGEPGHWQSDFVITLPNKSGYRDRYGFGGWTKAAKGRLVTGGDMVRGPHAFLFGLCTVIDNHGGTQAERERNVKAGREFDLEAGDIIIADGVAYRIEFDRYRDPRLVKISYKLTAKELTKAVAAYARKHVCYARTVRAVTSLRREAVAEWMAKTAR